MHSETWRGLTAGRGAAFTSVGRIAPPTPTASSPGLDLSVSPLRCPILPFFVF